MARTQGPINAREPLPWGWHFRPTGVELINSLKKKVRRQRQERTVEPDDGSEVLRELDLSQVEPWEIKDVAETCTIRATHADEHNQYFYTQKEQKYRLGKRSNRATRGGFWKATGRDKPIYGKINLRDKGKRLIGYRKALVFYQGRAPNGTKTDWILHEYRLDKGPEDSSSRDEQWVACHMFIKERNTPLMETQERFELQMDLQEHQQHSPQHGGNVKEEPRYVSSCQQACASHALMDMCPPEQHHVHYVSQGVRDDFHLPHLEEESTYPEITYPVDCVQPTFEVAPQPPRSTTGRLPSVDYCPITVRLPSFDKDHPTTGRLLSFDSNRPTTGRLPSFENDRMICDLLFGISAEQFQHSSYPAQSDDSLW